MCAPLILLTTIFRSEKLRTSNTFEVTRPAHLSGMPISLCSSRSATVCSPLANSFAAYPPMGPPPITATS